MPVVRTSLPDTQKTILTPVYYKVVQDLMRALALPEGSIVAIHKGIEISRTNNRSTTSGVASPSTPSTVSQRRVVAVITEDYEEEAVTTTAVSYKDAYPVFQDTSIDVSVYPIYVQSTVTVQLQYFCASKSEAMATRDDLRIQLSQMRNIVHHEFDYDIVVPDSVQEFVADVHALKSRLVPQGLYEYFKDHSTARMHLLTDMANVDNARLAIRERQVRVVGAFDLAGIPQEVEGDNETNSYKVQVPYKFTLDVPRGMCMSYPPMVANAPMPEKYLSFIAEAKLNRDTDIRQQRSATYSLSALSHFEAHRQISQKVNEHLPLNIPLFDDFTEREGHKGYVHLCSFLVQVDETDKKTLLNLKELGEYQLDSKLLSFLAQGERRFIVNPYVSVFYLGVQHKGKYFDANILEIDEELNVRSKVELPLLKPTRVTLSICLDTTSLNPIVAERMKAHPEMLLLYFAELVRGVNNFKPEFSNMGVTENTFYRWFILAMERACGRGDARFVQTLVATLVKDPKILEVFIGILANNYPRLYHEVSKRSDIQRYKVNPHYKRNYTGVEMYAMRTVMLTSTQAFDAENPLPPPDQG